MRNLLIISKYTFIEVYKSRILFNIILLGLALIIISYIASEFSYGAQARVALDFGIGSMYMVIIGMSVFIGVTLLSKEIESRTSYMVLSRPIQRWHFITGKFLGMSGILFVNIFLLGMIILSFFMFLGGAVSPLIFWCLLYNFFEAQIVLLIVIFFSLITNVTMSVIYTICVFVMGHVLGATLNLSYAKSNIFFIKLLNITRWFFPNLDKLNLKDFLIYKQSLPMEYIWTTLIYALVYISFLLILNVLIFERKELD